MSRAIEEEYKTLEKLGVKFEKESLEKWLFEAACQILEKTNQPKNQGNLNGCIYVMLNTTISRVEELPPREEGYILFPSKNYKEILIGEVSK